MKSPPPIPQELLFSATVALALIAGCSLFGSIFLYSAHKHSVGFSLLATPIVAVGAWLCSRAECVTESDSDEEEYDEAGV